MDSKQMMTVIIKTMIDRSVCPLELYFLERVCDFGIALTTIAETEGLTPADCARIARKALDGEAE